MAVREDHRGTVHPGQHPYPVLARGAEASSSGRTEIAPRDSRGLRSCRVARARPWNPTGKASIPARAGRLPGTRRFRTLNTPRHMTCRWPSSPSWPSSASAGRNRISLLVRQPGEPWADRGASLPGIGPLPGGPGNCRRAAMPPRGPRPPQDGISSRTCAALARPCVAPASQSMTRGARFARVQRGSRPGKPDSPPAPCHVHRGTPQRLLPKPGQHSPLALTSNTLA
jgi:hypothetical protein